MFSDNSSTAKEFFDSKQNYDDSIPDYIDGSFYDLWYERPYYGKIDTQGIAVYPREDIVENIDAEGNFQALNFVSDAFNSLQNYINFAKAKRSLKPALFGNFAPKKAWQSAPTLFDEYFESNIYNVFLNQYLSNKNIPTFKCFVKEYINFCRSVTPDIPLTFTGFIVSNNCTNKISGLIIDISSTGHDKTKIKIEDYYNDYDYITFSNLCRSYGFRLNKNAPWQLIADLSNEEMINYAKKYQINLRNNDLFKRSNFYTASEIGYDNFKRYLWQMYTDWYSVNTTYTKLQVENKFNSSSPMFAVFETKKINELKVEIPSPLSEFLNNLGEEYFLKLYLLVRLIEYNMESEYKFLEKYLLEYYKFGGVDGALAFIDKKITKTNIYTSSEFRPYFFN